MSYTTQVAGSSTFQTAHITPEMMQYSSDNRVDHAVASASAIQPEYRQLQTAHQWQLLEIIRICTMQIHSHQTQLMPTVILTLL